MYKDYIKEREGAELLQTNDGFVIVKQLGDYLYLQDIYVLPELRKNGAGRQLLTVVEESARSLGLNKILASCCPSAVGSHESMLAILATGFRLKSCELDIIYFVKEI